MNPEDTTTSTGQETAQALETTQPEELETQAVQNEQETTQDDTQTNVTSDDTSSDASDDTSEDAELLEWAQKKGVKTDDPVALLKMVRESERKMHETSKEAKQLRETFDTIGDEQGLSDTELLLNRLQVTDFYTQNPDARLYDEKMAEIIRAKPQYANDLDTVYKLARFESVERDQLAERQQVRKETLAQVAKAELAAPPQASASTKDTTPGPVTDDDIANMTVAEYKAYKASSGFNPFTAP